MDTYGCCYSTSYFAALCCGISLVLLVWDALAQLRPGSPRYLANWALRAKASEVGHGLRGTWKAALKKWQGGTEHWACFCLAEMLVVMVGF